MKKHSKALVFFEVSKKIPIVYSADRGRAEINAQFAVQHRARGIASNLHSGGPRFGPHAGHVFVSFVCFF